MSTAERAARLLDLHRDPAILQVFNVWDVITATVVNDLPGTRAIATASHSIAATFGYPDGENIPLELHLDMVGRIVAAVGDTPVSADLEAGYGDAGDTVRRAIGVGVAGANLEDALAPLPQSVDAVRAAVEAAAAEGVPDFVLNARTDAFTRGGDRDASASLDDAIERGRAYLEAGATTVFVPGLLDEHAVRSLVDALGPQRLTVINVPGSLAPSALERLGVARISYGPWTQRVALTAFADAASAVYDDGALPEGTRPLN